MKKVLFFLVFTLFGSFQNSFSQEDTTESKGKIEVFLIDSYITPEKPRKFILTFYTSDSCRSRIMLDNKYAFEISPVPAGEHKAEIDVSALKFDSTDIPFVIHILDKDGVADSSEKYEVAVPNYLKQEATAAEGAGSNLFLMCCLGGTVFGLPSPTYVVWGGNRYFSLSKEIPVLSLQTRSYKYPTGYFSVEYSYIFDAPKKNFLRAGYKHIFDMPYIEYLSPGVNFFTDLKGFNGISPEISVGWFKIYDLFTLYTRYRYNYKPGESGGDFHELSVGLYSGFFTFHLTL
ncbi:MAG: hypothetical protein WCJ01_06370 [Ignavibacteria bacterium]